MRKSTFHFRCIIFLLLFSITLFVFVIYYRSTKTSHTVWAVTEYIQEAPYLLTSFDNHLILIDADGKTLKISDINPRTLPPYDQAALATGIPIENQSTLEEILQDFS